MTTELNIVGYEIVVSFLNRGGIFTPRGKEKSKTIICYTWNGGIYQGDFGCLLSVNPVQKKGNSTPVYAILEDGTRKQINTLNFFQAFGNQEWFHLTVELEDDELGDLFDEDKFSRVIGVKLKVNATNIIELSNAFETKGLTTANKQGKLRRDLGFRGEIEYVTFDSGTNLSPAQAYYMPGLSEPERPQAPEPPKPANEAAKASIAAPILSAELDEFAEGCENVIVEDVEVESEEELASLFANASSAEDDLAW